MDFSKLYNYEDIKFENKHVKILNGKQEVIFEDDIEFPINFDDNAAAIVASRYLCNDSKNKETSIKQMFNRVSDTITTWGCYNNYFNPDPDLKKADEFNSKLRYYQIHKYFAFNSPVYFNVGLQQVPQTSACFILDIEDDMNSITELGKLEAKIFKKGSGAGSNLSSLRSSKEPVSGGGKASGPVSFLRSHDVLAGVVKSGGTLRRSAKLSCLNIDHPDIEEFIDCKLFEEEKLAILRKSGISTRDGYDLSDEVFFQNTNLSVRVTDEFMKRVESDSEWNTIFIKSGKNCKTYKAKDLLKKIAETSWKIADPGLQFHDTFNKWNTLANDGEIVTTNPCGEFASLNNTSCNLASLNLIKFFSKDKNNKVIFDYETFEDVIRTVITAQDILIDNSSYPNDKITINSKKYRNLGLGYTNLGGLLMWLGIPYDSDEGRSLAASLTAAMTAIAYETSADLADKVGAFESFEGNKTSLIKVLNQHYEALNNYSVIKDLDTEIKTFAFNTWTKVIKRDKFRNSQVSLLAPTGTISFIMNSITTGIEPEFSLVRYKRLASSDGATIKIVNPIVKESLRSLEYSEIEIPLLIEELLGEGDMKSPSRFRNDDKKIFLTASPIPGTNLCIDYMGHVKMCAAVQPFLSGAISKTINLPKDVTVDEIYNLYIQAWKMGLKGITVYRDGSKNFQPLTTKKSSIEPARAEKLVRKKLPDERPAITHKFRIGSSDGYITCGLYPDTGKLGEIFVNVSKEGSALSGFADALATVLSIAIQYGVPIKEYVRKLSHLKFEPSGFTSNPDIRIASSIVDYIARYIGLKFLSKEDQIDLGLISSSKDKNGILLEKHTLQSQHDQDIGPSCPNCGSIMRRLGSCYFCNNCSYNTGSCG
jgi:ribonucleoside-diphosphate reductase alpha chain